MIWLIAEDEADIRLLITTMVSIWGHQTLAFENGQKVWDWLDQFEAGTTGEIPSLILMDIRMPGKRGNELARRMEAIPTLAHIPVVLMTAFSLNSEDRQRMMQEDGVDLIIGKPLPDFDVLRRQLEDVMTYKRGEGKQAESQSETKTAAEVPEQTIAPEPGEKQPDPA